MTRKALALLEGQYVRALSYASLYHCTLTMEQFAAAHALDPEELEALRTHLEKHGVGI
jgi:hypothetical protein